MNATETKTDANPLLTAIMAEEKRRYDEYARTTNAFFTGSRFVTIAEAKETFDKYHKAGHWKDRVRARGVPLCDLVVFTNAVTFFHGGKAPEIKEEAGGTWYVMGDGYAC